MPVAPVMKILSFLDIFAGNILFYWEVTSWEVRLLYSIYIPPLGDNKTPSCQAFITNRDRQKSSARDWVELWGQPESEVHRPIKKNRPGIENRTTAITAVYLSGVKWCVAPQFPDGHRDEDCHALSRDVLISNVFTAYWWYQYHQRRWLLKEALGGFLFFFSFVCFFQTYFPPLATIPFQLPLSIFHHHYLLFTTTCQCL